MKSVENIPSKIVNLHQLVQQVNRWKVYGKSIVFTNGVFDLIHAGHLSSLAQAATNGDQLIVAINSDASVKRLKGTTRPVNNQADRALILANLVMVDAVIIFEEDTPLETIKAVLPDVLVKGGDYKIEEIAGAREVIEHGGKVILANMVDGISTSGIIEKINMKDN